MSCFWAPPKRCEPLILTQWDAEDTAALVDGTCVKKAVSRDLIGVVTSHTTMEVIFAPGALPEALGINVGLLTGRRILYED